MSEPEVGGPTAGAVGRRRSRSRKGRKGLVPYALMTPAGIWLGVLFIVPMGIMVSTSLMTGGRLSGFTYAFQFSNYSDALSGHSEQIVRSLTYAIIVTMLALVLSYPMTYWIAFYGGRYKSTLLFLLLLPFFVSFVIRTIQWQFLLSDNGVILGTLKSWGFLPDDFRILATPVAVVAGITYNFLPFTALPLYVSLERIDKSMVEAAKDLYASKAQAFLRVVVPLSVPGIFAAFLLTFIPSVGDYVNASVLGGTETRMVGNVIQDLFFARFLPRAAALSFVLMMGTVLLATIYAKILGTEEVTSAAAAA